MVARVTLAQWGHEVRARQRVASLPCELFLLDLERALSRPHIQIFQDADIGVLFRLADFTAVTDVSGVSVSSVLGGA